MRSKILVGVTWLGLSLSTSAAYPIEGGLRTLQARVVAPSKVHHEHSKFMIDNRLSRNSHPVSSLSIHDVIEAPQRFA